MLKSFYRDGVIEAGCDEAGRGCLAGRVFAAAVVLPADFSHPRLNDSKQMSRRNRDTLREIVEREALAWGVAAVTAERIDRVNILNASFEAMSLAVSCLMRVGGVHGRVSDEVADDGLVASDRPSEVLEVATEGATVISGGASGEALVVSGGCMVRPELLLIDGNRFRTTLDIPYQCIVGGDGLYASIAAASVLAKTHRDEEMERLATLFPEYDWAANKGYPTRHHRAAIAENGLTPHHRRSFRMGCGEMSLF